MRFLFTLLFATLISVPLYAQGVEELPPLGLAEHIDVTISSGGMTMVSSGGAWVLLPSDSEALDDTQEPDAHFTWMSDGVEINLYFFKTAGEEDDEFRDRVKTSLDWWKTIAPPDLQSAP
jgi:hypothetical protein